jgi:hypothetical protein
MSSLFTYAMILFQSGNTPRPSPTAEVKNVAESFRDFFSGVSAAEVSWMIFGIAMVGLLYWLSIIQLHRRTTDWKTVLFWCAWLSFWVVSMVIFGYIRIVEGGSSPILISFLTSVISLVSVFLLSQRSNQWQRIFSGIIIIIIGSAMVITIAKDAHSYTYALMFGCLFGIIVGNLLISVLRIANFLKTPADDESDGSGGRPTDM